MTTQHLGSRSVVFTDSLPEWDLNLHLILGTRRNYLIDTGLGSGSVAPIQAVLAESQKPTVVVNTHHHWDHVWGNHCFAGQLIIAHRRCRQLMAESWAHDLAQNARYLRGNAEECLPNLVFEEGLCFPEDGIRLFYTPGHTLDSISVFDEVDGVLNAGDNIGDTMAEIVPALEAGPAAYRESLRAYKALGVKACVSGHNAVLGAEVFDEIERALGR